jgi:sugar-specific transcriptional regulator TrmB
MSDEVIQSLKRYEFTEYEAKAYAALVDLGQGTAREICEISGVPHGRVNGGVNLSNYGGIKLSTC